MIHGWSGIMGSGISGRGLLGGSLTIQMANGPRSSGQWMLLHQHPPVDLEDLLRNLLLAELLLVVLADEDVVAVLLEHRLGPRILEAHVPELQHARARDAFVVLDRVDARERRDR